MRSDAIMPRFFDGVSIEVKLYSMTGMKKLLNDSVRTPSELIRTNSLQLPQRD